MTPNSARAAPRVEQNHPKLRKCSTAAYKFDPRGSESRTKSPKFGKMFYSVTFAKAVRSQITDKSPENDGLSVKCVWLTDKSARNGALSVKFE